MQREARPRLLSLLRWAPRKLSTCTVFELRQTQEETHGRENLHLAACSAHKTACETVYREKINQRGKTRHVCRPSCSHVMLKALGRHRRLPGRDLSRSNLRYRKVILEPACKRPPRGRLGGGRVVINPRLLWRVHVRRGESACGIMSDRTRSIY